MAKMAQTVKITKIGNKQIDYKRVKRLQIDREDERENHRILDIEKGQLLREKYVVKKLRIPFCR